MGIRRGSRRRVLGIVAAAALMLPASALAGHDGPDVPRYTGCLGGGGVIRNVAAGDEPAQPCLPTETTVHLSGGDVDAIRAGTGLEGGVEHGVGTLSLAPGYRLPQDCTIGQIARWDAEERTWACGHDGDTTYEAGDGLRLDGTTFDVNRDVVQTRVHGTCGEGSSVRSIDRNGAVVCEPDTDTTYSAGHGIRLDGTTFGVDVGVLQSRVTGTCGAGSSIRTVNPDGSVLCEPDTDTTYSAGLGLRLNGATFDVDMLTVQARVVSSCPAGSSIRAINAGGGVICETDSDTTYSAGGGLLLDGTAFSVDRSLIQARVRGTCSVGSSIRHIELDGTVTCEPDSGFTGYEKRSHRWTVPEFTASSQTVLCSSASKRPLGGGGLYHGGSSDEVFMQDSRPVVLDDGWQGWRVTYKNKMPHSAEMEVFVLCANV